MNPPEPDLKALFNEALERSDRAAYLDQACAENPALRSQLETLLKAHDEAGGFLGTIDHAPMSTVTVRPPSILEGPGTTIGPYKLLQQIGEGGMGVVFMAEQTHPVRRKVALKVIKPGMDTSQVVARFEAERQALAIMDHPNIARVLDVGATATGRPFFVMELVKGVPITEYCDRNHLTPKERLELFMPVCRSIQHAHQKGIIHRDIKPSNVLVTLHDGQPVPKVIDFGVAKAIDQRLTEKTMFTEFGAVIGTLEYMSPEQAEMGALDIDTRSDIYSLGVLLYELLTGSTPLERAKLRKAAFSEVLRRIREEEPTKPSTRLSESNEALHSISAQRKMEPARLTKLVKGDLDWIVMKSLEKDRTRRYETATGFARDIQRYLEGDAVEACPPSASYRLRKFARKHRAALATVGAFAFVLMMATAVSLGLAYWANRERVRAIVAEKTAAEQKKRAEEREQMAIDAVKRFGEVISKEPELKQNPALAPLRKRLLNEPLDFFKTLRNQLQGGKETSVDSLARLGTAYFDLGNLTQAIGDQADALRSFNESLAIFQQIGRDNPSVLKYQIGLANSYNWIGRLQSTTGRIAEALASHERVIAICERLVVENPSITEYQRMLASSLGTIGHVYLVTGQHSEAMSAFERALEILERIERNNPLATEDLYIMAVTQQSMAVTQQSIGILWNDSTHFKTAMTYLERALEILERLARENPSNIEFKNALVICLNTIGNSQQTTGRHVEAMSTLQQALAVQELLVHENPSITDFQCTLASIHANIGFLKRQAKLPAEALASAEKSRTIFERLVRENPSVINFQHGLASSYLRLGNIQVETGQSVEALLSFEKASAMYERLARENPSVTEFQEFLRGCKRNIVTLKSESAK